MSARKHHWDIEDLRQPINPMCVGVEQVTKNIWKNKKKAAEKKIKL
jgi:hypothetical protein